MRMHVPYNRLDMEDGYTNRALEQTRSSTDSLPIDFARTAKDASGIRDVPSAFFPKQLFHLVCWEDVVDKLD